VIVADRDTVSIGARNDFNDGGGTLVTTAVLFRTTDASPGGPAWAYRPTRVDVLLTLAPNQATPRGISDFLLTLYADDGSPDHNPGIQLALPFLLVATTGPLPSTRAAWFQVDVTPAGWPVLVPGAYYWVGMTPSAPLSMPPPFTQYNGALWSGMDALATRPSNGSLILPPEVTGDPALFTGRELTSERFGNDALYFASSHAAVTFLKEATNWASVDSAGLRFTNWQATGSTVRYGIQVLGWQVTPSNTPSASLSGG
jgi:hypothetical protein